MECAGQLRGLYSNTWSKCQKLNAPIGECKVEPLTDWTRKGDTLKLHELGDLPAGNRADANTILLRIQVGARSGWKTRIAVNHQTQMCVSRTIIGYCVASQSFSATGSNGRTYSTGSPRKGQRSCTDAAEERGIRTTSTESPS